MRILIILSLALLSACSSNLKKGDNMMEAEQFDQAVMYYERAYQSDPGDEEIASKLAQARTRMVQAQLIKVRLQRQGNQPKSAANTLNSALKNMKKWKIMADSGVKATLDEEVIEAGYWLNKELAELAENKNYNRFYYSIKQFDEIFSTGLADKSDKRYQPEMLKLGQLQCKKMRKELTDQSYFLHGIWQAYCGAFSKQVKYPMKADSTRYKSASISVKGVKVDAKAGVSSSAIARRVATEIEGHPWFSEQGKRPLKIAMSGAVRYKKTSKKKTFSQIYKAREETIELIKDPKNSKKIIRKLVHSKPVEKRVKFTGKEHQEVTSHQLKLHARVQQKVLSVHEQTTKQVHQTQSHGRYLKGEGVRPLSPRFLDKSAWANGMGKEVANKALHRLDTLWINAYCTPGTEKSKLAMNEFPARCAKLQPRHASVNAWTQAMFGLSYQEVNVLLYNHAL